LWEGQQYPSLIPKSSYSKGRKIQGVSVTAAVTVTVTFPVPLFLSVQKSPPVQLFLSQLPLSSLLKKKKEKKIIRKRKRASLKKGDDFLGSGKERV